MFKPCNRRRADQREQEAADNRADDPKANIKQYTFAGAVNDLAADEAGDEVPI